MVGILTVARHPEDYIAYIRISQAVLLAESERISYDWALETAKARNNRKAIAELERIGPPLNGRYGGGVAAQKRQRRWVQKFGGAVYGGSIHTLARVLLSSRAYSLFDKIRWFRGGRFSLRHLWTPENIGVDLFACVPELSVPVYILQGRYDYQTAFATAERYAQRLRAPLKRFIPFECSAHTVPFDEPQRFRQILLEVVLQETLPAGN